MLKCHPNSSLFVTGILASGEEMMRALVGRGPHAFAVIMALVGLLISGSAPASAASLVVDAETGEVIAAEAPNHLWYPASQTKMMTVYVALSEIKAGRLKFDDKITVSAHAANQSPVKFGLRPG